MFRECRWVLLAVLGLMLLMLPGCGSNSTPGSTKVVKLAISPQSPAIALGSSQQFTATETLADGTTMDVTSTVTWASSAPKVATIGTDGMVTSLSQGTTHISASLSSRKASTVLTINPAALTSLTLTPTTAKIAKFTGQQFTATGKYTNGSMQNISSLVTWTSSQPTIANISKSGLALAGSVAGNTVITASMSGFSASANLTVTNANLDSIAVTPADSTIPVGVFRQFVATGTFSDGSTQDLSAVTQWSSSSTSVAQVSSSGLLSALAVGGATISATLNSTSGSTDVTVATPQLISLAIQPSNAKVAVLTGLQLTAIGAYDDGSTKILTGAVIWTPSSTSSSNSIVTVNAIGFASAPGPLIGTAMITASLGSITTSTSLKVTDATLESIVVTPVMPTIAALGVTVQFTATGTFNDGSTQDMSKVATWTSSVPAVATMTGSTATSKSSGMTTIQAAFPTPPRAGSTTLNVTTVQTVSLTPANATISVGGNVQFILTGRVSNGTTLNLTTSAKWSSSNPSDAQVTNTGLATGLQGGSATITASYSTFTPTAALTVTGAELSSIAVSPTTATIAPGTTQQFVASGIYSDQSMQYLSPFVNWTSSDLQVATISDSSGSRGMATAAAPGSSLIGAVLGPIIGAASLSVSHATLVSIAVTPATPSLTLSQTLPFTAVGTFSDSTTQNITSSVTWSSSVPAVATINTNGVASSAGAGTTSITAKLNSVSGSTTLTVVP